MFWFLYALPCFAWSGQSEMANLMTQQSQPLKAALWMIGAMVSFSVMAVAGRELAPDLNTFQIMFLRSLIGLFIVLGVAAAVGTMNQIKTDRLGLGGPRASSHGLLEGSCKGTAGFGPWGLVGLFRMVSPKKL